MVLNCFCTQLDPCRKFHISLKLLLNLTNILESVRFPRSDKAIGIGFWILQNVTNAHALIVPLCVNIYRQQNDDDDVETC